jgi:hypothetical protein
MTCQSFHLKMRSASIVSDSLATVKGAQRTGRRLMKRETDAKMKQHRRSAVLFLILSAHSWGVA